MKNNISPYLLVLVSLILIYVAFSHKRDLKDSNDLLHVKLDSIFSAQRKQITIDSIKYSAAIDSLSNQIKIIDKKRINELHRLKSKVAKINYFTNSSEFSNYNDSLERCCTMR